MCQLLCWLAATAAGRAATGVQPRPIAVHPSRGEAAPSQTSAPQVPHYLIGPSCLKRQVQHLQNDGGQCVASDGRRPCA